MAGRILFELFFFSIPFLVFGLYVLATTTAEHEGRRQWPVNMLFLIGLGLAVVGFFAMVECLQSEAGLLQGLNAQGQLSDTQQTG